MNRDSHRLGHLLVSVKLRVAFYPWESNSGRRDEAVENRHVPREDGIHENRWGGHRDRDPACSLNRMLPCDPFTLAFPLRNRWREAMRSASIDAETLTQYRRRCLR